jgi:hypothetical protein
MGCGGSLVLFESPPSRSPSRGRALSQPAHRYSALRLLRRISQQPTPHTGPRIRKYIITRPSRRRSGPICGRPPSRKGWQRAMVWSIAVICPAFVRGADGRWPRWGYADRVPNMAVMSKHRWVPRVVPILGPTDHHLAAVLASTRAVLTVKDASSLFGVGKRPCAGRGRPLSHSPPSNAWWRAGLARRNFVNADSRRRRWPKASVYKVLPRQRQSATALDGLSALGMLMALYAPSAH